MDFNPSSYHVLLFKPAALCSFSCPFIPLFESITFIIQFSTYQFGSCTHFAYSLNDFPSTWLHVKVWCWSSLSLSFWEMQGHWCTLTTSASQIICNVVMYFDSTHLKYHKILFLLPYTVNGYLDSPTYLDFLCFPCYTTELPSGIIFLLNEQHPLHFSLVWIYWSNFTFPSAVYEVFNVSTSSPTIIIHLFNHTHSSSCEVDSYCAFDFHSLND